MAALIHFDVNMFADGWHSVFDNIVTRDLTYQVKAKCWIAEGVYRYYTKDAKPGLQVGSVAQGPRILCERAYATHSTGTDLLRTVYPVG